VLLAITIRLFPSRSSRIIGNLVSFNQVGHVRSRIVAMQNAWLLEKDYGGKIVRNDNSAAPQDSERAQRPCRLSQLTRMRGARAKNRADPDARQRAFETAREDPPSGFTREEPAAELRDVLDSVGDTCPECIAD
jgi:hypothetical protein